MRLEGPRREQVLAPQADRDPLSHCTRVRRDHVAVEEGNGSTLLPNRPKQHRVDGVALRPDAPDEEALQVLLARDTHEASSSSSKVSPGPASPTTWRTPLTLTCHGYGSLSTWISKVAGSIWVRRWSFWVTVMIPGV